MTGRVYSGGKNDMAKTRMRCPFTNKLCDECAVYRGRHYYLSLCPQFRGYIPAPRVETGRGTAPAALDLRRLVRKKARGRNAAGLDVKLRVVDMGSGEVRSGTPTEARSWDWGNPEVSRFVDGIQMNTWVELAEALSRKAEKGHREVTVYEAPRFML